MDETVWIFLLSDGVGTRSSSGMAPNLLGIIGYQMHHQTSLACFLSFALTVNEAIWMPSCTSRARSISTSPHPFFSPSQAVDSTVNPSAHLAIKLAFSLNPTKLLASRARSAHHNILPKTPYKLLANHFTPRILLRPVQIAEILRQLLQFAFL